MAIPMTIGQQDVSGRPEDLFVHQHLSVPSSARYLAKAIALLFILASPGVGYAQVIYATGETPPGIGDLIQIDLGACTFCDVSVVNDGSDFDLTLLPNGNYVNASNIFIKVFDPPNQNPIFSLNISPQVAVGNILNPAGTVYIATQQGLGVFNPANNQFSYIGDWPAGFIPVVQMELWYQGGQLFGYFGFPTQQIAQIDVSNPGNSTITGTINNPGPFLQGACNVGSTVYIASNNVIYELDQATGDLEVVCDFSNTSIIIQGISSVPAGFPNYPCLCTTNAGTLPSAGVQNICVTAPLNFPNATGVSTDNNDLLQYIMFSNPSDTAGSIVATSDTPFFTFDPATMQTGVTYYVAAMAGDDLNGNINLSDPCLDFSNARAIIWRPSPAVSFAAGNPDICAGNCLTLSVNLVGTPPFTLTYNTPYATGLTQTFNGNTGTLTLCVPAGAGEGQVQLDAVSLVDAWCDCQ